jgi:hypothetical protein
MNTNLAGGSTGDPYEEDAMTYRTVKYSELKPAVRKLVDDCPAGGTLSNGEYRAERVTHGNMLGGTVYVAKLLKSGRAAEWFEITNN